MVPSRERDKTRGRDIRAGKVLDSGWTLALVYGLYAALCVPIQHKLWMLLGSYRLIDGPLALGLTVGAVITLVVAAYIAPATTEKLSRCVLEWTSSKGRTPFLLLVAMAVIIPAVVAYAVLDRFQNSGDEFAYFFQAEIFAHGHLWAEAPPLGDTFAPYRTWIIGDKWLSQYPPGWPLAMAAAIMAGIPAWSVNALLGGGSAAGLLSGIWRFENRAAVLIAVALYILTPFYLLNAGSFYSHLLPALAILLFCLACLRYQRSRSIAALITCGAVLGVIGITRYFTLILLMPALAYWMFVENRGGRVRMITCLILGGLPFLAFLMTYQNWITGSPLKSTYSLITNEDTFVSFRPADIALGARLTAYRFAELTVWTFPLLLPTYLVCLVAKLRQRAIVFYDLVFPAFIVGYVFFADLGGNRYGPRYYFDAFPLMLVTIVSGAPRAVDWAKQLLHREVAIHIALISVAYLVTALPFMSVAYHRQVAARQEPYRMVAAKGLEHAIVIIDGSSGRGLDAQDLARNDEHLQSSVLYARAGVASSELHRQFPDRSVWIYSRDGQHQPGVLSSLLPTTSMSER